MTYSLDNFSQINVPGENFPLKHLIVLITLGVLGSILTVHLVITNPTQDSKKQESVIVVNEAPPVAELQNSPNRSDEADTSETPIASQISSKDIAKYKINTTSFQLETGGQEHDNNTAKIDSTIKILTPENTSQPILQQPTPRIQEEEIASRPEICPPMITFRFASESTNPISQGQEGEITQLKDWLQNHPQDKIFITGHTSSRGEDEYNLLLSYRRAKAVTSLLIQSGITQNRLKIRAYGEQAPVSGQPPESRLNRRVSMQIESTANCMNKEDTN